MRNLVALVLMMVAVTASAAELEITVLDANGDPISDAVVWAIPDGVTVPPPSSEAIMDQRNRTFVPHVLPIQTGTAVRFPNSDNVRHQVYSFSAPKRFQLPLYEGSPAEPVIFDKPGIVSLGCNIHDRMSAFIVVVDTPWFGKADNGKARLEKLPEGTWTVRAWYEKMRGEPLSQSVKLLQSDSKSISFTLGAR